MRPAAPRERRVVVTGLGCVSPLGGNVDSTWQSLLAGRSGIGALTHFDAQGFDARIAGEVTCALDLGDLPAKEVRRLDRTVALALAAAHEAWTSAGVDPGRTPPERCGVAIGSGIGGIGTFETGLRTLIARGPSRVSPFTIPMIIGNMAAGYVAIRHDLRGPNLCHVSACASGAHSIGEAARLIVRGDADVMLAGGSEAAITPLAVAGFAAMRALSLRNDEPERASRPFDRARDGFVIGEGAALLVLEEAGHARARGARIHGEILGYAATADALHMAIPDEEGRGAQRCMQLALADARLAPAQIDAINPHATSTPAGDRAEALAIRRVFGERGPAVSATKSMLGHLLGAAGAIEALICLRSLESGLLPATLNLDDPDPDCALDHVRAAPRELPLRALLSNSFGFGGTNAALVLGAV